MEGIHHFKSQYYQRSKLNVSDMTDHQMHSIQEDRENGFYSVGVSLLYHATG